MFRVNTPRKTTVAPVYITETSKLSLHRLNSELNEVHGTLDSALTLAPAETNLIAISVRLNSQAFISAVEPSFVGMKN